MLAYLSAGAASLLYIALKAMQQRQVMAAQYWRMPPLSYAMAFCEVFITGSVAHTIATGGGLLELSLLAFSIGTGGSAGSILGTWLHARRT